MATKSKHKQTMKTIAKSLYLLSILGLLATACNQTNDVSLKPSGTTKTQTSQSEYERLMGARTTGPGVKFDITDISRTENTIQIKVKGGCSADDFTVIWDGVYLLSYPQIMNLIVSNEHGSDSCNSAGEYTLNVDLNKLVGGKLTNDLSTFQIKVSNGSSTQDLVIDEHGVVTNK